MKRKLFTLLFAIVTLSAFQANAQARWILADTSGLAKNTLHSDSFPNNKLGLYNWLTVGGDNIKVHPQDTANRNAIYEDGNSKFDFTVNPDSSFTINRTSGVFFSIEDTTEFEIVQFSDNGRSVQRLDGDTFEGYLAPVQRGTLGSDSANLILAGADKNGNLSFKRFFDFAAHVDTLPASPCLSYQFNNDTVTGRLYQSDNYPYFQTYHTDTVKSDSALVAGQGTPINWSDRKAENNNIPQDNPFIYSYYNFKYVDNSISINGTTVRLDTIVNYVKSHAYEQDTVQGLINKGDLLSGIDTTTVKNDSLLYFKVEDGHITFTALAVDSSWTNGVPTTLKYGEQDVWYYIDATDTTKAFFALTEVLIGLFHYDRTEHFDPAHNQVERYIYKEGDDWRPLYIKVVPSCDSLPYEYVTSQWLSENYYDIAAVSQEIVDAFGTTDYSVSTGATIVSKAGGDVAKFLFEYAATIRASDSTINGVGKFSNYKDIELFYIKNDSNYLTVLDTTVFAGSITDSTVTNTQLGWEAKKTTVDSLRQAFAIVYNSKDSIITLLPVASYQWKLTGTTSQYDKTKLHYNEDIGKKSPNTCGDLFIDLSGAWYITQLSKTSDHTQRLIIADPQFTRNSETIWFKMTKEFKRANIGSDWNDEDKALAIYDQTGKYYYPLTGAKVEGKVTDGMIRHHWTVKDTMINEISRWIFTPELETIYGNPLERENLTDTFIALNVGDSLIELISGTRSPYRRDTITVKCVGHSSPFLNLDPYVGISKRVAILESLYGDRNISYLSPNDSIVKWGNDSLAEAVITKVGIDDPDTYTKLIVYNSNVQYLGKNKRHQVPYYVFSYKDEEDEEYFLTAQQGINKDSVRWVKLDEDKRSELLEYWGDKEKYPSFKFCLPYTDGEDHNTDSLRFEQPVYLQTLDNPQVYDYSLIKGDIEGSLNSVRFSEALVDSSKYEAKEGVYSAIDQYKDNNMRRISSWNFYREDVTGSGWVRINAVVDEVENPESGKDGVFTNVDNSLPGTVFIVPSSKTSDETEEGEVNYGVLAGINHDVKLTLVSAGGGQIGFEKDSIWYYRIKHEDLYLTDAIDSVDTVAYKDNGYAYKDNEYAYKYFNTVRPYAFFTTNKLLEHSTYKGDGVYADSAFRQTFALQYVRLNNEIKNDVFFVVSSANYKTLPNPGYRYLSRLDTRLVFIDEEDKDKALQFQWGKVDENGNYTDIKVIGVPATIYGVAGGVKIVNATGAVSIYTIDGRLVTARAVVSPDQTIAVPAGIYIVRSGANVAKVVVR